MALPAFAVEETIDDFSSASNTAFVANTQVKQSVPGTATATDTNVPGVLGGTRTLDVTLELGSIQAITAGVNIGAGVLQYSEAALANGNVMLTYPNIPKGLNFASGIEVLVNADAQSASTGYDVSLTLQDSGGSTTVTMSSNASGLGIPFSFSFSSFPGIDPGDLIQIVIGLDGGGANDLQLEVATTFGTPPRETSEFCQDGEDNDNDGFIDCFDPDCLSVDPCAAPSPALSPTGLGFSILILLAAGSLAMLRLRRSA